MKERGPARCSGRHQATVGRGADEARCAVSDAVKLALEVREERVCLARAMPPAAR
jgi:hypothetical protein